jgi:hypothetical protein
VTPRLVFRPEAEAELLDARAWYEEERVGLGAIFAAAVETTITAILRNPLAFPRVKGDDEIIVLAIMQGRRNPRHWRSRR